MHTDCKIPSTSTREDKQNTHYKAEDMGNFKRDLLSFLTTGRPHIPMPLLRRAQLARLKRSSMMIRTLNNCFFLTCFQPRNFTALPPLIIKLIRKLPFNDRPGVILVTQ